MIDIDADNLKHGVLGLVIALVEVIRDALKIQAFKRMEGGSLEEEEIERLGQALMELDTAIEQIKEEQGIAQSVQSVRDGLDNIVDEVLEKMINPEKWREEVDQKQVKSPLSPPLLSAIGRSAYGGKGDIGGL